MSQTLTATNRLNPIRWSNGRLILLDQRKLPDRVHYLHPRKVSDVATAICTLAVRGAPAIGIAAAYGVVVGLKSLVKSHGGRTRASEVTADFNRIVETLRSTRPTAVNLFWALERMRHRFTALPAKATLSEAIRAMESEAIAIHREDERCCAAIGRYGAKLLPSRACVVTHCNAGMLATGGIGTALGVIYEAVRLGKTVKVYADETRPLLQGARLTAFELAHHGIDVTLMSDGMSAALFSRVPVDAVIVGADRIARNGDTANKIGTFGLAISAHFHNVPFYVAAPASTFDLTLDRGQDIPIEQRSESEVTAMNGRTRAPKGVRAFNPAFDVTPARLITAIITDRGVIQPVTEREVTRVLGVKR